MRYLFLFGGVTVVVLVCTQISLWIFDELKRLKLQKRHNELSTEVLIQKLAAARQQRISNEDLVHGWNGVRKFAVSRKVEEGGDICSFYLAPHDKKAIPLFKPGQYLTFEAHIPGHDKKVIRCYSLSDAPGRDYFRVSIKKILPVATDPKSKAGVVSSYFHDHVKEGDILDVKAPGGHFYFDENKQTPVVLIGGGVGITPVMSMLNHIVERDLKIETWFFLGVRNQAEHVFKRHLEDIAHRHQQLVHLNVCYSKPDAKDVKGRDYQYAERVSVELMKKILPSNNYEFYICGPGPMMNSIVTDLKEWGVPEKNIHFEAFGAASVKTTAAPVAEGSSQTAAKVVFSKSNKEVEWKDNGSSLLELAEMNGIALPFGCRAGNCGTCLLAIKEGEISYLKEPGCQVESGACLSCISKPKGKHIVLDA